MKGRAANASAAVAFLAAAGGAAIEEHLVLPRDMVFQPRPPLPNLLFVLSQSRGQSQSPANCLSLRPLPLLPLLVLPPPPFVPASTV